MQVSINIGKQVNHVSVILVRDNTLIERLKRLKEDKSEYFDDAILKLLNTNESKIKFIDIANRLEEMVSEFGKSFANLPSLIQQVLSDAKQSLPPSQVSQGSPIVIVVPIPIIIPMKGQAQGIDSDDGRTSTPVQMEGQNPRNDGIDTTEPADGSTVLYLSTQQRRIIEYLRIRNTECIEASSYYQLERIIFNNHGGSTYQPVKEMFIQKDNKFCLKPEYRKYLRDE